MPGDLLSSKVVVVEEEPRVRGIPSLPTSIAAAVGIAERGPVSEPVLCSSFEEYRARFGGFTANADLPLAAMGFFENGGSQLWCVRVVHHTDVADPTTATALRAAGFLTAGGGPTPAVVTGSLPGPFALEPGAKLVLAVDGGVDQEATVLATAASLLTGAPGPYALADGQTLLVRFDSNFTQQVTFAAADFADITTATDKEVAAVFNESLLGAKAKAEGGQVRLTSDTLGTSSKAEVLGGTAAVALGFPAAPSVGTGNVASARSTSIAEVIALASALVGALPSATPTGVLSLRTVGSGVTSTLQVRPGTAAAFGLDTDLHKGAASGAANAVRVEGKDPGAYSNRLEVEVRAPVSGEPGTFDLVILEDGSFRERFPGLRMAPDADRYVERVDNGLGIDNEVQGTPITICRGQRTPWSEIWPDLRFLS